MKVKDLIRELKKCDPERVVIMAKDSEGNAYSPLRGIWTGSYRAETTWYGDAGLEKLTKEDIEAGFSEDDVVRGKKAVILTPVN